MTKINVSTHLNKVLTGAVREFLAADPDVVDTRKWMRAGRDAGAAEAERLMRSEEHTSELQSRGHLVCRLLLEKKKLNRFRAAGIAPGRTAGGYPEQPVLQTRE